MRKLIMMNRLTVDGLFAGPRGENHEWFVSGADITIFGSGTIIQQLTTAGLIDEHIIVLTPLVLGKGKPMFKEVTQTRLELIECRPFKSGNVVLHYRCR